MQTTVTRRPRNVNAFQAAAILYGDWGTSKAYVIGLAFALAGYSSFWLIAAVSILIALVAVNYITICKFSPYGGGVYSSAKKKSDVLALIGAFFLISDYTITAALSALSCFEYLGVMYPSFWAMGAIAVIGFLNYFGPKHTGNLAFVVGIATFCVVIALSIVLLPFWGQAIHNVKPLEGGFLLNWEKFVGIIVALSGVEAIANTTGVMKLDPGSTEANPSVKKTATKAILFVMFEVCIFTTFFGLMINAIPGLEVVDGNINAPDQVSIRDYMLRYMGNFFLSMELNPAWGYAFGTLVGVVFAILLLSAVNTAIVALVSLLFVMSRDGELPANFQKITRFGVPVLPLILAFSVPIVVLLFVNDIASLANLYAVGFVGAIATNLGSNVFDKTLPMTKFEKYLMFGTFIIMVAIEVTLFITKPDARRFVLTMLTGGLILRALVVEHRQKQWMERKVKLKHASLYADDTKVPLHYGAILCAVRTAGKTLNFALQEAKNSDQPLYILFVREQKVITEEDRMRIWLDDDLACKIFDYAKESSHEMAIKFFYMVSDSPADSIVETAKQLHVSQLIVGRPRQSSVLNMLRGNVIQDISELLPQNIDLVVIS
ncbi:MAG: amino acid permease [Parachlamydiaceae bacterium]|nr:amino acid permease [Parachlamydiaceae bacterium]